MRVLCAALVAFSTPLVAQQPASQRAAPQPAPARLTRDAIVRAEDARGNGSQAIQPILDGLRVAALRPVAMRAIGRLERPDLVQHVLPFLSDTRDGATAADAIAQSLRGMASDTSRSAAERALVDSMFHLIRDRARAEQDWVAKGSMARSMARLPYHEARQAREVEAALIALAPVDPEQPDSWPALEGVAHGLYTLARARRALGDPAPAVVDWLRQAATYSPAVKTSVQVRRPAMLALTAAGQADQHTVGALAGDPDAQVRRLAVAGLPNVQDDNFQREVLGRVSTDRDPMVRLEWVRVYRQLAAANDCKPLLAALADTVHHVRLAVIDALGGPCKEQDSVVAVLRQVIESGPAAATRRTAKGVSWHARAHALLSLARVDDDVAEEFLRRDSRHPVWQVRLYVARAATVTKDSSLLSSLAFDQVGSVREAAIQGLSASAGHLADLVFVRALTSKDYHVVLAAARALRGAPAKDSVKPAVMAALERITREQRQTSRDPRMELLARVREWRDSNLVQRLQPLLNDFDDVVAYEVADIVNSHSATTKYSPAPRRLQQNVTPLSGTIRVRVTLAPATGGGAFEMVLDANQAPMTAARVVQLIRSGYYDGLTFHRVVPNFVVQGGSPGMNEYVGDGPFLRDELSQAHHARYTMGISTRGRDTGDAQWFINLVDNYRLDHEYTVFATVVTGMDVVDRILEGDVMQSVRVLPTAR